MPREIELKCQPTAARTAIIAAEGGGTGATIRYQDEKDIRVDDRLVLVEADGGLPIVEARVQHVEDVAAWRALDVIRANGATYSTRFAGRVVASLNDYYDDVAPTDRVKVVCYDPYPTTLNDALNL